MGCLAKVKIPHPRTRKIGTNTLDIVIVGYALDSNVGRFLVITSEVSEIAKNTIIEARDAVHFENTFPLKSVVYPTRFVALISDDSSRLVHVLIEKPRRRGEELKRT